MKSAPIDINRVRQLFGRPEKLQPADFIYREIAGRMLERLQLVRLNPAHIVDAGCGRGADLSVLRNYYPDAQLIGVDSSQEFLQQALAHSGSSAKSLQRLLSGWLFSRKKNNASTISDANVQLFNSDFGCLPLADQAADLVWSNLALHWHPEPDQVFKEWRRILKVDGLLMFSCFGPDSLKEIRYAFDENRRTPHTLPFVDMHDFGDMLVHAGFATPVMDMEIITLTYATVAQLLAEVRALGGNPLQTRMTGLMGKTAWQTMCNKLEQSRNNDGRIALTLEVIYGHAFTPPVKQNQVTESVIQFIKSKK